MGAALASFVDNMDEAGFRERLRSRGIPEPAINASVVIVREYEDFLRESCNGGSLEHSSIEDFRRFSGSMMQGGLNTEANYLALARYGRFINSNGMYLGALELLDGADVLDALYAKLGDAVGEKRRDEILSGTERPPLGTPSTEKPRYTQAMVNRMEGSLDSDTCKKVLIEVAHGINKEEYRSLRDKFLKSRDIDDYMAIRRQEHLAELQKHRDEGTLFYNQEITDEVLEWVKSRPDIMTGERRGNTIVHTKIPYMAKEYLAETDPRMKRYHACHCAWARETILTGGNVVSPTFCYCSAGYTRQPWEMALGQDLQIQMTESVLKGDLECQFVIRIPDDVMKAVRRPRKRRSS